MENARNVIVHVENVGIMEHVILMNVMKAIIFLLMKENAKDVLINAKNVKIT
jgi:hypothetical protein